MLKNIYKKFKYNFYDSKTKRKFYFLSALILFNDIKKINTKNNIIKKYHHQMPLKYTEEQKFISYIVISNI